MAKNAQKTNALGMELTPDSFAMKDRPASQVKVEQTPVRAQEKGKSLTRNISITLQEEAVEKLEQLAQEQDISKSKVINGWLMSML